MLKISMNILLEYWTRKAYKIAYFAASSETPAFSAINMLPPSNVKMSPDVLYVGLLSDALCTDRRGSTVLCIRDRMQDSQETEEAMRGIAVVCRNISLSELFNETSRLFFFLQSWNCKLYEALSTGCGLEAIFDIIEELKAIYPDSNFNFVHATDADFSLLGYTKNIPCDDPNMENLVTVGRYGAENVRAFEKFNCAKEWECSYSYPMVSQIKLLKYPVVIKTARFAFGFVQIVMVCNHLEPLPGLVELFNLIADVLIRCIHTTITLESRVNYPFHKLLQMLLKGEKAIPSGKGRLDTLGIPLSGLFDLFVISWLDTSDYKLERAVKDLYAALPEAYIAAFEGQIVFLNTYSGTDREGCQRQSKLRLNRIVPVWTRYNAVCGVSAPFEHLEDLTDAYKQANNAIECAHQLYMQPNHDYVFDGCYSEETKICHYDDLCIYDFFRAEKSGISLFTKSDCAAALKRLHDDDELHHRDNCNVLYTFLICERSPSRAAAILNMHKNNVIYRMQKIQSIILCDLDNPEIRLKLLMAYKFFSWFGIEPIKG